MYAALSTFGCFSTDNIDKEYPLFTEPVLCMKNYEEIKKHEGYKPAWEEREQIQIVITTLGDAKDPHDIYRNLHEGIKTEDDPTSKKPAGAIQELINMGWVGNMQFRPYSQFGPITEPDHLQRIPTLFELEDFRDWVENKPEKRIVLVVSPCGACKMRRVSALLPLLKETKLRIWNCLVVDRVTAQDCLEGKDCN